MAIPDGEDVVVLDKLATVLAEEPGAQVVDVVGEDAVLLPSPADGLHPVDGGAGGTRPATDLAEPARAVRGAALPSPGRMTAAAGVTGLEDRMGH